MFTKHQKNFIKAASASVLDTVAGKITASNASPAGDSFFILLKIDDIQALVPWADSFTSFVTATYEDVRHNTEITTEKALALTRQRTAKKLRQLIHETKTISEHDVHYCFGVITGLTITLTSRGTIRAFLLHASNTSDGKKHYRWLEITATPLTNKRGGKNAPQHPVDEDASLVTGTAAEHDVLLIVTDSVIDTIGLNRIERILIDTPIDGARALLERSLHSLTGRISFAAMLFALGVEPRSRLRQTETVTSSMTQLLNKQTETDSLLVPTKKTLASGLRFLIKPRGVSAPKPTPPTAMQTAQVIPATQQVPAATKARVAGVNARKGIETTARVLLWMATAPLRLVRLITERPDNSRRVRQLLNERMRAFINRRTEAIEGLPRSSQKLLVVSLLFAYLFTQTLVYLADRQVREQRITVNNEIIAGIQDRLDKAQTNTIVGNDAETARLVKEATNLLATFPENTKSQREQKQLLEQSIKELSDQLEKIVTVSAPEVVANLEGSAFANASGLLFDSKNLVIYQGDTNSFAQVNADGSILTLPITSVNIGRVAHGKQDDSGNLVFLTATPQIATLQIGARTLDALAIENPPKNPADFSIYNDRLYLLSATDQQIYRYQKTASGYSRKAPWVNGNVSELTDSESIAVDGSVFVLTKTDGVKKLFGGAIDATWHANKPLTVDNNLTHLTTTEASKNLYAFDPLLKRVIVWSKDSGQLKHQYSFPTLPSLNGYAVDSGDHNLYVLSNQQIVKTPFVNE